MIAILLQQAEPVDWALPVTMLLGGLVIGAIVAVIVARRGASSRQQDSTSDSTPVELEIRDLDAKRDSIFDQLRELDDTSVKLDADQLAIDRYELELEAARTLQRLDQLTGRHTPGAPRAAASAASGGEGQDGAAAPPVSPLRGFLWGIGSAAAIAALVLFVAKSADERGEGGSVTGTIPGAAGGMGGQQQDPAMQQLFARVQAEPDNLDLRLELAYQQLMREQLMEVFESTQYVLERRPGDPAALTYQAVVRLAMGQTDAAQQMLNQAVELRPDLVDARVYLALAYAQGGKYDEAKKQIDEAIRVAPAETERIRQLWAQIEAQKNAAPQQAAAGKEDPHAGIGLPPMAGSGAPAAAPGVPAATRDPRAVRGTITLPAGSSVPANAAVFLIVRPAGAKGGPPVAVSRIDARAFPLSFELSQANSMMGQPLPDSMLIEARVDLDGNPMTRDAGAPAGSVDDVAAGAASVSISLAPR